MSSNRIIEENLINLFKILIKKDKEIEKYRIELFLIKNFNPLNLFKEIDYNNKNYIIINDLIKYLNNFQISFNEIYLRRLIRIYDKKRNFFLNYEDFFSMIKPYSNIENYSKTENNNNYYIKIFLEIIKKEIDIIFSIADLSEKIRKLKDFTIYESFMLISNGEKYFDINSLKNFLSRNENLNFNNFELEKLIYRLDFDNDKKISYEEFQEIFFSFQVQLKMIEQEKEKNYLNSVESLEQFTNKYLDNNNIENKINISFPEKENDKNENINSHNREFTFVQNLDASKRINSVASVGSIFSRNSTMENNFNKNYYNLHNSSSYKNIIEDEFKYNKENNKNLINVDNYEFNFSKENLNKNQIKKSNKNNNENENNFYINSQRNINSSYYSLNSDLMNNNKNINLSIDDKNNFANKTISFVNNYNNNCFHNNFKNKLLKKTKENYYKNEKNYFNFQSNKSNIYSNNNFDNNFSNKKNLDSNFNNINDNNNKILINYFLKIIEREKNYEELKENLSLKSDVVLSNLFYFFNENDRKKIIINKNNFLEFCKNFSLFPTKNQINLIFKRFSFESEENLNYEEFYQIFLPLKEEYKIILKNRKKENEILFENESIILIKNIIKKLIENEIFYFQEKIKILENNREINYYWKFIINNIISNNEYIDIENLKYYLEINECFLTNFEINLLFNKLDWNKDSYIHFNDFLKEFKI